MVAAIAVVGLGCRYPDADTPEQLWENVLSQRRSFRRIPPERLNLADYHSPDRASPDTTYSDQAALLEDFSFDRLRFRIPGAEYRSADLTHWLALEVADTAITDAGLDRLPVSRSRIGVVVGNTLTGEFSRASVMRLRWPYVRRVLGPALAREGMPPAAQQRFLAELEREFKQPFPQIGAESLSGGLSNTIAGRICNLFDFGGGGYTVDGACSSSLLAVIDAARALGQGELDLAVAGGVDLSLDPFELVGFAKTGALAADHMRVYDREPAGFWPGEGCGFVVLARLRDAESWGAKVYAVIQGYGVSSDGRGGLTRPEAAGQLTALRRAYAQAGYGPETVSLFEGHGTGTEVGDAAELAALTAARREAGATEAAAIGTIKANIGHTKAAAGVAGLVKATLSVHHQVLPPTTGCDQPAAAVTGPDAVLRVLASPEPWPARRPVRASVSAMGFGGINSHLALAGAGPPRVAALTSRERRLAATAQDAELVPLAATDRAAMIGQARALQQVAADLSFGRLRDLAIDAAGRVDPELPVRAALVVTTPAELERRAAELAAAMTTASRHRVGPELSWAAPHPPARIGFLFSGQGAPTRLHGGALARRFPVVAERFEAARLRGGPDPRDTAVAQPAIVTCSAAAAAAIADLGITAVLAVGHSLGELTALHWAGAMSFPDLVDLARARGAAMSGAAAEPGAMADIAAPAAETERLVAGTSVVVAAYNAAGHTVVAGPAEAVAGVVASARARGWRAVRLPVSHAFHSPLMAGAEAPLRRRLATMPAAPMTGQVVSTVTGAPLASPNLTALLVRQLTAPVRFTEALADAAGQVDLLIELGPGRIVADLACQAGTPALATDAGGPRLAPFLAAVGAAFALGAPVQFDRLVRGRVRGAADPWRRPSYLGNPCELARSPGRVAEPARVEPALAVAAPATAATAPAAAVTAPAAAGTAGNGQAGGRDPLGVVRRLVAARAELPVESVRAESKLLTDLNLSSIAIGQLAADAAAALKVRPLVAPTELAGATVGELAGLVADAGPVGEPAEPTAPAGVDDWVRAFTVAWVPAPRRGGRTPCAWRVVALDGPADPAVERWFGQSRPGSSSPSGVVVDAREVGTEAAAKALLAAVQAVAADPGCARLAVLHRGAAGGLARTLAAERPTLPIRLLDVTEPGADEISAELLAEAESGGGFEEVRFTSDRRRLVPRLRLFQPIAGAPRLGAADVLLVSGGGKGIGAEAALAMARGTGARVGLMGRSDPARDAALAANLERLAAAGLAVHYAQADVADRSAVAAAVGEIEAALGPVTAILHAAGVNQPRLLPDLDGEMLADTIRPKVAGLAHLLAAVDQQRLGLLVGFGSIIGRTGLRGEGHYATANEHLRLGIEAAARSLPQCRCVTIEWSVWSGVGMGDRLGAVEALIRDGVTPIGPDEGIAWLRRIADAEEVPTSVVVTGRYGQLSTLPTIEAELPLLRFLERPLLHYPGVELVAAATLSTDTDRYLDDHTLDGVPLLPAVLALEAMAQAATGLTGEPVAGFEGVDLPRPVTVPAAGGRQIQVAALIRDHGRVEVTIRSEETGFGADHMRATCLVGTGREPSVPAPEPLAPGGDQDPMMSGIAETLYRQLLFHGERFRRVLGYRRLRARWCVATIGRDTEVGWFSDYLPGELVLGDPGARDSYIHAAQACIPHRRVLPASVERIDIHRVPAGKTVSLTARERHSSPESLTFDITVVDEAGRLCEAWYGLSLRCVADVPVPAVWPAGLFSAYLERRMGELAPTEVDAVALACRPDRERADRGAVAVAEAADRQVKLRHRPDGRPEVDGDVDVSISYQGEYSLATIGRAPVACDLEAVPPRGEAGWTALVGEEGLARARALSREIGEDLDRSATRLWVASECARKAGRVGRRPIVLERITPDRWAVLRCGGLPAATYAAQLSDLTTPIVVGVLTNGSTANGGRRHG